MRVVISGTVCESHWHHAGSDNGHCKLYHPYWPTAIVNTVWSVSTSQVALRVIILHICLVRISGQSVLEELPANAAISGSHVGWHNGNAGVSGL